MPEIIPWHSDVVQRPVKFVRGGITQAAIGIQDLDTGEFTLYTESGDELGPGVTAASGLGYTVCTDGQIASDGSCFIAAESASREVKRWAFDENGNLSWNNVFSAGGEDIRGISYCGGYFFVTSLSTDSSGTSTAYVARGAEGGTKWSETTFLAGTFDCGSVACKPDGVDEQEKPKFLYCSVGSGQGDNPNYGVLYSATSTDGLSWSKSVSGNPYSGVVGVAAGKGVFVTGGFDYSIVSFETADGEGGLMGTGQAEFNSSSNGSSWSRTKAPLPGGTTDHATFGDCAVFVDSGDGGGGHFIGMADDISDPSVAYLLKSISGTGGWSVIGTWTSEGGVTTAGLSIISTTIGKVIKI